MQTSIFDNCSQKQRILNLLKRGPATSRELNDICFRYSARILDLRREGYTISTKRLKQGLFVFKLEE